jgi:hypothetical protein
LPLISIKNQRFKKCLKNISKISIDKKMMKWKMMDKLNNRLRMLRINI